VPDVTGRQQDEARQLLQSSGFAVTIEYTPVTDPGQDGVVLAEQPHAATKARAGSAVTITVGQLVTPTPTTTATIPTTTAVTTTTTTPVTTTP
jgi:serine/threonine-protein kinase